MEAINLKKSGAPRNSEQKKEKGPGRILDRINSQSKREPKGEKKNLRFHPELHKTSNTGQDENRNLQKRVWIYQVLKEDRGLPRDVCVSRPKKNGQKDASSEKKMGTGAQSRGWVSKGIRGQGGSEPRRAPLNAPLGWWEGEGAKATQISREPAGTGKRGSKVREKKRRKLGGTSTRFVEGKGGGTQKENTSQTLMKQRPRLGTLLPVGGRRTEYTDKVGKTHNYERKTGSGRWDSKKKGQRSKNVLEGRGQVVTKPFKKKRRDGNGTKKETGVGKKEYTG